MGGVPPQDYHDTIASRFRREVMNIYHFKPRAEALDSPHWWASIHKAECYVYEDTLEKAIRRANSEFGIAVARPSLGEELPNNPWAKDELVTITEVTHMSGNLPPKGTVML